MGNPVYSICICNYNMADTLEDSLATILDQLDDRFETVVVDDGSTDNSVALLHKMQEKYKSLRVISLPRDKKRKLGYTRNESILAANGEYVLLHLDCDDLYAPYLTDFTKAFHMIERAIGRDILLSGHHVNIARRHFLLGYGPYRNIFRGEDRDMWLRLASDNAYIPLIHTDFVTRMPKTQKARLMRSVAYTYDHLINDFRASPSLAYFFRYEMPKWPKMSLQQKILRALCLLPAYVASLSEEALLPPENMSTPEQFVAYREKSRGKLSEILARFGKSPDWNEFTSSGREIFK